MKEKLSQKGFSLIEAVLYLAIVAILLTAVLNFHITLGNTSSKLSSNIDVSRNRRLALSAMDYLVKNSDGFLKDTQGECSTFNTSPQVLALYFEDDTYLPGTCVQSSGGGVRITLDGRRVKMTCYPDIPNNGLHRACNTTTYPEGNSYYLTSPDVVILDDDLGFSTTTATTTTNNFVSLTTNLSVGILSHGQTSLAATSTATSTVTVRNEVNDGLVAFWKFDDASGSTAVDSSGWGHDMTCTGAPSPVSGLIADSDGAFDFDTAPYDTCNAGNPDAFNFDGAFTLSAWLQVDYVADGQDDLVEHGSWTDYWGYMWTMNQSLSQSGGRTWLRIFSNYTYSNTADDSTYGVDHAGTIYNITHIYDPDNDEARLYIFDKTAKTTLTTTKSGVPVLVNKPDYNFYVSRYFDGVIDDMRVYNRALSDEEVWALQSQGKY